jgi:hypothetical protein
VVATALNMIVGLWWLVSLPDGTMARFMGGSMAATTLLGLGILLALVVLIVMVMASMAPRPAGLATTGALGLLVLLAVMVLNRDQVRRAALEAAGFEPVRWVTPQWGPILLFILLLVLGLAAVVWMVTALARGRERAEGT